MRADNKEHREGLSRREFLARTGAAVAGLTLAGAAAAEEAAGKPVTIGSGKWTYALVDGWGAPPDGMKYDMGCAVVVDSNSVAILHSSPTTCTFGIAAVFYAKLHVLAIDTTSGPNGRRLDVEILTDINCGYRGLEIGLPRR